MSIEFEHIKKENIKYGVKVRIANNLSHTRSKNWTTRLPEELVGKVGKILKTHERETEAIYILLDQSTDDSIYIHRKDLLELKETPSPPAQFFDISNLMRS